MNEVFLTSKELASRWRVTENTIRHMRRNGKGPSYLKLSGAVRYSIDDIAAYENSGKRQPKEG